MNTHYNYKEKEAALEKERKAKEEAKIVSENATIKEDTRVDTTPNKNLVGEYVNSEGKVVDKDGKEKVVSYPDTPYPTGTDLARGIPYTYPAKDPRVIAEAAQAEKDGVGLSAANDKTSNDENKWSKNRPRPTDHFHGSKPVTDAVPTVNPVSVSVTVSGITGNGTYTSEVTKDGGTKTEVKVK